MAANTQTYRHTYIHTTSANAVMLVWGSLRLAPISSLSRTLIPISHSNNQGAEGLGDTRESLAIDHDFIAHTKAMIIA